MKNLLKFGLISVIGAAMLNAATYKVDPVHSHVGFEVKHLMIANVKGNFEEFSGSFEYDQKTNTLKALEGKVAVKSIDTDTQKRDDHLRSADFFYVEKYPMMTFVLTKVVGDKAYGKLTMRGVTKDIELNVATSGMVVEDPWGHMRTGVVLNGTINRQDYGVAYNANMKSGGLMIGNEVKIEVVVEGIQVK